MKDLRFLIVNSKLQHAQILRHELENRVSFDVYQDTEEKDVWKLMDGGKDDIYVYDRCGRLAYYIPFPLSIMSGENSLLPSAILATYFRSPCGETCDKTERSSLEDYLNNKADSTETTVTELYTEMYNFTTEMFNFTTEMYNFTTEMFNFTSEMYPNEIISNRSEVANEENGTSLYANITQPQVLTNESDAYSLEDFDYPFYSDSKDYDEDNTTQTEQTFEIQEIFISNITYNETEESVLSTNNANVIPKNISNENPLILGEDNSDIEIKKPEIDPSSKRKLNRCAEADLSVCNNWSKRRLLRAQNCCSSQFQHTESCRNFGKKRCKKIRTVLKCCIKTAYVEATTTEAPTVDFETTIATEGITEVNYDIECCKNVRGGRLCRVATTPTCESDEFISEGVDPEQSTSSGDTK